MKLHLKESEFRVAVTSAAAKLNLPEHVIEKDYWVTKLLLNVVNYKHSEYVIFKGGTSLSKGHKLINRFSEDVDLALHPDAFKKEIIHKKEGDALYKVISSIKDKSFKDVPEEKTSEKQIYKRVYSFPQLFEYPKSSQIHERIIVELNSFSTPFPIEKVIIKSLITEYFELNNQQDVLAELEMLPFQISILSAERAFCEKLLALRRASHKNGEFFSARIRHVYDVHQLFGAKRIQDFVQTDEFEKMLNNCHHDDEINKKISAEFNPDFRSYDLFKQPDDYLKKFLSAYGSLKDITFDNALPLIEEVADTLKVINTRLEKFNFS